MTARLALISGCLLLGCGNGTPPGTPNQGGQGPTGGSAGTASGTGGMSGSGAGADGGMSGSGAAGTGGSADAGAGTGGDAPGGTGGGPPMWGLETRPTGQTCLAPATRDGAAALLSETGCMDSADPKRTAATVIPYGISSPLWSDGADKQRFFALPDGATIDVKDCDRDPDQCMPIEKGGTYEDEGDFIFPIGTVLIKTFSFGDQIIETRLLVRAGEFDYWGYSYEWRADQSDADLVPSSFIEGKEVELEGPDGTLTWVFPGRSKCFECHTSPAGTFLGPEASQLDRDFTYPNGVTGNQLETLERVGFFSAPLAERPPMPDPADDSAPLEARARAYLHANCSMCHRPGSVFNGFDARFETPFAETMLCGVTPEKGDLGVTGALRITPGDAESSVVSLRMHARNPMTMEMTQMPPLATNLVDEEGVGVVDAWIDSLSGCP